MQDTTKNNSIVIKKIKSKLNILKEFEFVKTTIAIKKQSRGTNSLSNEISVENISNDIVAKQPKKRKTINEFMLILSDIYQSILHYDSR